MLATGFILLTVLVVALLIAGAVSVSATAIADEAKRKAFRLKFVLFLLPIVYA